MSNASLKSKLRVHMYVYLRMSIGSLVGKLAKSCSCAIRHIWNALGRLEVRQQERRRINGKLSFWGTIIYVTKKIFLHLQIWRTLWFRHWIANCTRPQWQAFALFTTSKLFEICWLLKNNNLCLVRRVILLMKKLAFTLFKCIV